MKNYQVTELYRKTLFADYIGTPEGRELFYDLNMFDDNNNKEGRGQISHDIALLILEDVQRKYIMDAARNRLAAGGTSEIDELLSALVKNGLNAIDFDKLAEDEFSEINMELKKDTDELNRQFAEWQTATAQEEQEMNGK